MGNSSCCGFCIYCSLLESKQLNELFSNLTSPSFLAGKERYVQVHEKLIPLPSYFVMRDRNILIQYYYKLSSDGMKPFIIRSDLRTWSAHAFPIELSLPMISFSIAAFITPWRGKYLPILSLDQYCGFVCPLLTSPA